MRATILCLMSVLLLVGCVRTDSGPGRRVSDLTANELAETLGVHWWIVKLPEDIGPKDKVGVELVDSDGKRLEGGGGFMQGSAGPRIGGEMRVFCWEDEATGLLKVRSEIADDGAATASYTDYLKGAAVGGPGNGAVQNVGDILMKFDSTKSPSFTGGNVMSPGQVGLRVCIERRP